ncbi:hypothetical protein [Muricauda sp. MAR_2010_75]|jgi:predicted outer membrane repeat protein|uniref:hypothetical protein n=1 Tax=Allomuricauda sp. MAR_2010_75 TaxID=1250232 RepID=UPI000566B97C|nr:hypothetical protein [Muricauda sp. MAR_2010_75]
MKNLKPMLLGFLFIFYGCSKDESEEPNPDPTGDEEPEMVTYFTFEVALSTAETDNWIIIHDKDGELLDYREFEAGDSLIFDIQEKKLPDNLTISLFTYDNSSFGNMRHTIKSYPEIQIGSNWNFGPYPEYDPVTFRDQTGSFDISVNNAVSPRYETFSDKDGHIYTKQGLDNGVKDQVSHLDVRLNEYNNIFYTFYDSDNESKYFFIEDISDEDIIEVDYSEFNFYDYYLEVDIPISNPVAYNLYVVVQAFEDNQSYSIGGGIYTTLIDTSALAPNPIKIGYLDLYSRYRTRFSFGSDVYEYDYEKYGVKPENISIPKNASFTIADQSFSNYQFITNLDYQMKDVQWEVKEGVPLVNRIQTTWNVISSPYFSGTIGEIPEEIQQTYPNLRVGNLNLISTSLHLDFLSYPDLIHQEFIEPELKAIYDSHEIFRFYH